MSAPEDILQFWFGGDPATISANWWMKNPAFDTEIREKFESDIRAALRGDYDAWKHQARSCLAYIILLDQFSRNAFRDRPESFAQDPLALAASLGGQERGLAPQLSPVERWFFYMPMEHAEDPEIQRRSLRAYHDLAAAAPAGLEGVFRDVAKYAERHAEIIFRFGRFPHRNVILGRVSSPEEIEFLKEPGSSF